MPPNTDIIARDKLDSSDTGQYSQRFQSLDQGLHSLCNYWQFRPFTLFDLPWRSNNKALCHWLDQLTIDDLQEFVPDKEKHIKKSSLGFKIGK